MSASAMKHLVTSAVARWRAFSTDGQPLDEAKATAARRKLYTDELLAAFQVLLNSSWPWPRVESCIGKVLEVHAGIEGYPPADRVLSEVRQRLRPSTSTQQVLCQACEREGGVGVYLDSTKHMLDAVYGVNPDVPHEAPMPMCIPHFQKYTYRKWGELFDAGVINTRPLKPDCLQTKAEVLERIQAGKKKRETAA